MSEVIDNSIVDEHEESNYDSYNQIHDIITNDIVVDNEKLDNEIKEDHKDNIKNEIQINEQKIKNKSCIVCEKEKSSYKCPKCLGFYCSLACFKLHKEENCQFSVSNQSSVNTMLNIIDTNKKTENDIELEKEYILLSDKHKNLLKNNQKIKELINNKRFLNDIKKIDESNDRENELKKMRLMNSEFNQLMDELYDSLEPNKNSSL